MVSICWMSSVVGYGLWTYLLTRHPANRVAPFSLGVPVVGLAAGLLVFSFVVLLGLHWLGGGRNTVGVGR